MKENITYHRASTTEELNQILRLQKINLSAFLSNDEKQTQGFVTLQHDFDILKQMNDACAHCIAKNNEQVVGYALSMLQEFKSSIPILEPMFNEIDQELLKLKRPTNYIAMGQICIDKDHRNQGIFKGLYHFMSQELKHRFDAIITEVDVKNIRSSNAHKAVGFQVLKNYTSNNQLWEVIVLYL